MTGNSHKHFGKFRGTVTNNQDPIMIGRVQVLVHGVSSYQPTAWALPCVPLAGPQSGIFVVPAIGANVWVEFERGDLDFPVWVGGYWDAVSNVPMGGSNPGPAMTRIVIQSQLRNSLTISDVDDGTGCIVLQSADGASLRISRAGITIQNGKGASIQLVGPTVDINTGALVVT